MVRQPAPDGNPARAATPRSAPAASRTHHRAPHVEHLTHRELEVLQLLPSGLRYTDMARELAVSLNTVKSHLKSVYRKLGAGSRHEALDRASELDLVTTARPRA